MKTVMVLFGGKSVEHDVSVITGVMTANSIKNYNVIPVYVNKKGQWYTGQWLNDLDSYNFPDYKKLKRVTLVNGSNALYEIKGKRHKKIADISMAINCMHGGTGEDGSISGLLNACEIYSASPDVLSSAVTMNKAFTKIVLKGLEIATLPCCVLKNGDDYGRIADMDFPLIVKPNCSGSSIGINVAKDAEGLERAVTYALKFGEEAIIEPYIKGVTEINCACYRDDCQNLVVSECEKPLGREDILSFNDKYSGGKREFPAKISANISDKIKETTRKIYNAFNFRGVIRIDYFVKNDEILVNEINSVPGSMAYYLFGDTLKGLSDMLDAIINEGEKLNIRQYNKVTDYKSGILTGLGSKGAKHL